MGITYDAPSNTITVTGYTEGTPCTFLDIWNADQGGGWGVVSKQGTTQFMFDCKLVIGDGSTTTWFADTKKQITFNDIDTVNYEHLIDVKNYAHFSMGTLISETDKSSKDGVQFVSLCDNTTPSWHQPAFFLYVEYKAYLHLYSCSFITMTGNAIFSYAYPPNGETVLYNCYLENTQLNERHKAFNIVWVDNGIAIAYNFPEGEKFYCYSGTKLLYTHFDYPFSIKNLYIRGVTYMVAFGAGPWSGTGYFINTDSDNWAFLWAGGETGKVYRQYEFDTHCQDKEGNDLSGVSVVGEYVSPYGQAFSQTTNGNGDIPTQTIDHGFFDSAHGDTEQVKTPLKVTYSKLGYQTVVKYYDLIEKVKDIVVLHKAIRVFDSNKPVVNLKRTDPENKKVLVL